MFLIVGDVCVAVKLAGRRGSLGVFMLFFSAKVMGSCWNLGHQALFADVQVHSISDAEKAESPKKLFWLTGY